MATSTVSKKADRKVPGVPRAAHIRRTSVLAIGVLCALTAVLAQSNPASAAPLPSDAWWYTQMDLPAAWRYSQGAGVIVGLVDSGVNAKAGDLVGQVLPGKSYLNAGDGRTDVEEPGEPGFGHGTDMAALIAGTGNGAGIKGVAPKARILPVQVGTEADDVTVAAGIRWAVDHGAQIVNLSLGAHALCSAVEQASIDYAVAHDVIVVAGSGDDPGPVATPASCVGAVAVGGIESDGSPWSLQGFGPELDFVAPADHLEGIWLNGTLAGPGGSGTSQAAAFVSGTFALLRARFRKESARQIVTRALWNVHNGLGGKIFAKRVSDRLGYGEILPYYALTKNPPAGAANPIYDKIKARTSAVAASASASAAASTSAAAAAAKRPNATVPPVTAPASLSPAALAAVAVLAVIVVIVVGLMLRSRVSRRRPAHAQPSPAPGTRGDPGT